MSQATIGWLMLAAAALTFVFGAVSRLVVGRRRESKAIRRLVHAFRRTGIARVLFGRFEDDVLDDDELDTMIRAHIGNIPSANLAAATASATTSPQAQSTAPSSANASFSAESTQRRSFNARFLTCFN